MFASQRDIQFQLSCHEGRSMIRISIDIAAYRRNLSVLQRRLSPAELMAVVKDDAYGHGLESIVAAARDSGVSRFAVLDIPTGVLVRKIVPDSHVQLFAWLFSQFDSFAQAIEAHIDLGVSGVDVLDRIGMSVGKTPARVHLKIDSGLHRNGASVESWPKLVERALYWQKLGRVEVIGVWTHIGEASDEEDDKSQQIFNDAYGYAINAGLRIQERHLAASAASYARPDFRYDFSRVGGFTYGVAPGDAVGPAQLGLEPVMTARAEVCDLSEFDSRRVLSIDAGFLDGVPDWVLVNGRISQLPQPSFEVSIEGKRFPIINVEPTRMTIDCASMETVPRIGQEVILFGSHLRSEPVLQEWADALGTVGEEIVVRMGQRNERNYC